MIRSLVGRTLLLVGGVIVLLGAAVVFWITAEERAEARDAAREQQRHAEAELRALARDLLGTSQETTKALVEGAGRRLVRWIEEEPLGLYRDPADPDRVDTKAIKDAFTAEVRARAQKEAEHAGVLVERVGVDAERRIDRVVALAAQAAERNADAGTADRRARLATRLALLLAGLAALLGVVLVAWVVNPVRRLQAGVKRIAGGDLVTPLPPAGGTGELADLSLDVERMRDQLRGATTHLESEVARKTEHLSVALAERTRALEELDAAKDRLVQSAKMAGLGTLAGGVAHEFNNLLGGILASVNNARSAVHDASVAEDLDLAARTTRRAAVLVQALLGVARPGQRALKPVDLGQVADDVLQAAGPAAAKRRIALEGLREGAPVVEGDEGQLHQVALNLVTNALQAVRDGGHVTLRTGVHERRAVLEVTDDGPGVPADVRSHLFEPFFTTRESGTGLGLFVSYGIVERHGGRIDVGDAPGGGARLTSARGAAPLRAGRELDGMAGGGPRARLQRPGSRSGRAGGVGGGGEALRQRRDGGDP